MRPGTEGMNEPRRQKRDISGWLVLDKPFDMTSTQAVGKVRWLFSAKKAGHAGTLDPLATGILPIALGEATKTVPNIQDGEKLYRFTVAWGAQTTTDDAEGEVLARSDVRPTAAAIEALLPRFTGAIAKVRDRPWYSFSRQINWLTPSAMKAVANIGSIRPRLAVVSDRMMTAVSGARTTPAK